MTTDNNPGSNFPAFGKYRASTHNIEHMDISEFYALVSNKSDRKILKNYVRTYDGNGQHINNPNATADKAKYSVRFYELLEEMLPETHAVAFEQGDRNYLEGFIGTQSDANDIDEDLVELFSLYETVTERNDNTTQVGTDGLSKKYIIGGETRTGKNHLANKLFIEFNLIKYGEDKISIATNQTQLAEMYDFIHLVRNQNDILNWAETTRKPMMGVILDEMDDPGRLNAGNNYMVEALWTPVYNQLGKLGVQFVCYITHRIKNLATGVRGGDENSKEVGADYYMIKPDKTNRQRMEMYKNYSDEHGLEDEYITLENLRECSLNMDSVDAGSFTLVDNSNDSKPDSEAAKDEAKLNMMKCDDCNQKAAQFKTAPLNPIVETGYCWEHMPEDEWNELQKELGIEMDKSEIS